MTRRTPSPPLLLVPAIALAAAAPTIMAGDVKVWNDPAGDAVIRRTDPGAVGGLLPATVLPDVIQVRLSGWQMNAPFNDPYNGTVPSGTPHLLRLDVIFKGVINPPGPLEALDFRPFEYGPSPLYGSLEFDVDRERDTGGEYADQSQHQHLANVARFGGMPAGSLGAARGVRWGTEIDMNYASVPQFERSGADFLLSFCGCWSIDIQQAVNGQGNTNGTFEAGETWIVKSRFWRRAGGYHLASFMTGGSGFGQYDPEVQLRWSHNTSNDRTTITLVYPLTMQGAAQLTGTPLEPMNYCAADHTSIQEGLQDIIDFVNFIPLSPGPTRDFALLWQGQDATEHLDPTRWRARALFGTSYATQQPIGRYVWTDHGFDDVKGDQNSDELLTLADRLMVRQAIAQLDGGPHDGDGIVNGSVQIINFGPNFSSFDVNGDGTIDALDSIWYCKADVNDDLVLNVADFTAFLNYFGTGHPRADINGDGVLNISDFSAFLAAFGQGCP
jgi:hypothetical protein